MEVRVVGTNPAARYEVTLTPTSGEPTAACTTPCARFVGAGSLRVRVADGSTSYESTVEVGPPSASFRVHLKDSAAPAIALMVLGVASLSAGAGLFAYYGTDPGGGDTPTNGGAIAGIGLTVGGGTLLLSGLIALGLRGRNEVVRGDLTEALVSGRLRLAATPVPGGGAAGIAVRF